MNRQLLHWGAWGIMTAFFWAVLSFNFPWYEAMALSVGNFLLLAALFYFHAWLTNRFLEQRKWWGFFVRSMPFFAGICAVRFLFHAALLKKYLVKEGILIVTPEGRLGLFVFVTSFIFAAVGVIVQLLVNRYRRERNNLALLAEKQAAELQLLKSQINPHFLFNALNNLYSLVVTKSDLAGPLLVQLSTLLRYVIYESQKGKAELTREIQELRNFIELFSIQHAPRPKVDFQVNGPVEGRTIEPMILLPLVENCFKHGDFSQNPDAFCQIVLSVQPNGSLYFSTQNSYNPNDRQKDKVGGVGLDNMQRRLQLLHPGQFELKQSGKDGVFVVELTIFFSDER